MHLGCNYPTLFWSAKLQLINGILCSRIWKKCAHTGTRYLCQSWSSLFFFFVFLFSKILQCIFFGCLYMKGMSIPFKRASARVKIWALTTVFSLQVIYIALTFFFFKIRIPTIQYNYIVHFNKSTGHTP
jgi:hypothetical protein